MILDAMIVDAKVVDARWSRSTVLVWDTLFVWVGVGVGVAVAAVDNDDMDVENAAEEALVIISSVEEVGDVDKEDGMDSFGSKLSLGVHVIGGGGGGGSDNLQYLAFVPVSNFVSAVVLLLVMMLFNVYIGIMFDCEGLSHSASNIILFSILDCGAIAIAIAFAFAIE